jgi:hypothetical protein
VGDVIYYTLLIENSFTFEGKEIFDLENIDLTF